MKKEEMKIQTDIRNLFKAMSPKERENHFADAGLSITKAENQTAEAYARLLEAIRHSSHRSMKVKLLKKSWECALVELNLRSLHLEQWKYLLKEAEEAEKHSLVGKKVKFEGRAYLVKAVSCSGDMLMEAEGSPQQYEWTNDISQLKVVG